jgi:hypothetical protein
MVNFFCFEDRDCRAVATRRVLINDRFLFRITREEDIVRLKVLLRFRLAEIVRPSEAEFLQNLVEQFLAGESFVIFGACDISLFVKRLTKFIN